MTKFLGISFLLFLASIVRAENTQSVTLSCDVSRSENVLSLTLGAETYALADFNFRLSPFVPEALACQAFVEELNSMKEFKDTLKEAQVQELLNFPGSKKAHLVGPLKSLVYDKCISSSRCVLKYPYNLSPAALWDMVRGNRYKDAGINRMCHQRTKKAASGVAVSTETVETFLLSSEAFARSLAKNPKLVLDFGYPEKKVAQKDVPGLCEHLAYVVCSLAARFTTVDPAYFLGVRHSLSMCLSR